MTLIEVRDRNGLVGRCDERCYDAKYPDCDCICNGKNHKKGLSISISNTREMLKNKFKEINNKGDDSKVFIPDEVKQLDFIRGE